MSETKWTPGPWDDVIALGAVKKNGVRHPTPVDEEIKDGESWLDMRRRTEPERIAKAVEKNANHVLQIAAPELYEAMWDLFTSASVDDFGNTYVTLDDGQYEKIGALLDKARGQS